MYIVYILAELMEWTGGIISIKDEHLHIFFAEFQRVGRELCSVLHMKFFTFGGIDKDHNLSHLRSGNMLETEVYNLHRSL